MTMPPEFEIRREIELPATPEQVWDAVTTDAGTRSWLFPSGGDPEPRQGGKTPDGSVVTAWDKPRHFGVRFEAEGGFFNALEFIIEARGGTTVLRYVHSGIFTDDWDNQYDAAAQHTDFYLHTLSEYLAHFAPRAATYVGDVPGGINAPASSAEKGSFSRLREALGVDAAREGDHVKVDAAAAGTIDGVVDYLRPNFIGIRTADGLYRFFGRDAFGMPVGMTIHAFNGVDADQAKRAWGEWLTRVYA